LNPDPLPASVGTIDDPFVVSLNDGISLSFFDPPANLNTYKVSGYTR